MIDSAYNPLFFWVLEQYSRFIIHRSFREIFLEGDTLPVSDSLLVVGNHFSWWDGFFVNYLNYRLWHKRFHVMMLEEQLRKRPIFRRVGAFSVAGNGRSPIASLRYAQRLLNNSQNLVTLFPQGHFISQASYPLKFEKGAQFLINVSGCRVKMVVMLVDYFSFKKPFLSFYVKDYDRSVTGEETLVESYNQFFAESVEKQNQKALLW